MSFGGISICIPNFNGIKHLQELLEKNLKVISKYSIGAEMVICDDQSTDNSLEFLQLKSKEYSNLKITSSKGFGKGASVSRNLAVGISKYPTLFFIDNDVLLSENSLETLGRYLDDDSVMVACCGYKYYGDNQQLDGVKVLEWKRGYPRFTKNIFPTSEFISSSEKIYSFGVQGAYFSCPRKVFDQLGGFDQDLLDPYMLEESDLMYRHLKRGGEIIYAPDTIFWHRWGGTINSKGNKRTQFLSKRNRLLFVFKNIHSKKMIATTILNTIFKIFNPMDFKSVVHLVKERKKVFKAREVEKKLAIISDEQIFSKARAYSNILPNSTERKVILLEE